MPNIQISDSIYRRLLKKAQSFDDSAELVIERLLDHNDESSDIPAEAGEDQPSRVSPGSVLPVRGYWIPILELLDEAGGSAPSNDIVDALEKRMENLLTPGDFQRLKSGEIRWRNRARFARLRMKERGLLSDTSHRGVWEITEDGRHFLAGARGPVD